MKNPFIAGTLNFFLPGAGFVYLGYWKSGVVNFLVVLVLLVFGLLFLPAHVLQSEGIVLWSGLGGGSLALASGKAKQLNANQAAVTKAFSSQ